MTAIVGQRVTQAESLDAPKLPARTKSRPPFVYMHHPHRWQFIPEVGEWLPLLGKLKVDPGVGAVSDGGGTDLAVAQKSRQGWIVIRPSDERLGPHQWYVQKIPKQGKGAVHADVTTSVEVIGGRSFWKEGGEGYRSFLRHLVGSGIIAPINDNVKRLKIEQQLQVVDRLESSAASAPHNQVLTARLSSARKLLEGMQGITTKPSPAKPKATTAKAKG